MSEGIWGDRPAMLAKLHSVFAEFVPHNRALGMTFVDYGDGMAQIVLPYRADLVGNPETGVLHGGVLSSLLDSACGASVMLKMKIPTQIATLDLRIDSLRAAVPGRDLYARATCYKLSRNVGFVRATAFHDDEDDPVASAAGAFMIATSGKPVGAGP